MVVHINRPSKLAIHGLDYLDISNRQASCWAQLTVKAKRFVAEMERRLEVPVPILFTGPQTSDIIDLRSADQVVRLRA